MLTFRIFAARAACWALGTGLLAACSVSDQVSETAAPSAVPAEVHTDADRRAIYNSNGAAIENGYPVPDATPGRVRLGEQAADINREKRIENLNTNDPNNTTPETRVRRIEYATPVSPPPAPRP